MSETNKSGASLDTVKKVGKYEVHKLTIGEFADAIERFEKLPQVLATLDLESTEKIMANLGKIVAKALPDFIGLIGIATKQDPAKLKEELGFTDAIKIVRVIWEQNDFLGAWAEIKEMYNQAKGKKPQQ